MKKKTFLKYEKPILTCMVQADNPDRIKELIEASIPEGAEAFGMQLCKLKPEYRSEATYRDLFDFASPYPTYVTNYRRHGANADKSDDELAEELVRIAKCGATLCDVMGDYFDRCEGELTMDPKAVSKQIELIKALHGVGAEVLMSSHVMKFISRDQVLNIALEHQRRGADISKIVIGAESMAEQIENLRTIDILKQKLDIPFLLLCGGESRILRRIGGAVGNCMSLCVHEYDEYATPCQPLLADVKIIRDKLEAQK